MENSPRTQSRYSHTSIELSLLPTCSLFLAPSHSLLPTHFASLSLTMIAFNFSSSFVSSSLLFSSSFLDSFHDYIFHNQKHSHPINRDPFQINANLNQYQIYPQIIAPLHQLLDKKYFSPKIQADSNHLNYTQLFHLETSSLPNERPIAIALPANIATHYQRSNEFKLIADSYFKSISHKKLAFIKKEMEKEKEELSPQQKQIQALQIREKTLAGALFVLAFILFKNFIDRRKERKAFNEDLVKVAQSFVDSENLVDQQSSGNLALDQNKGYPLATQDQYMGESAFWLNSIFAAVWRLFQKSTKSLVQDIIQPTLDELELPDGVRKITLVDFYSGRAPPVVNHVKRISSRSLSEVQFEASCRWSGDSEISLVAEVALGSLPPFKLPIKVSHFDIDTRIWAAVQFVPYAPFVLGLQVSLMQLPKITFDMNIFNSVPLTAIPVLDKVLKTVFTEVIPKDFLFPNAIIINLCKDVVSITDRRRADLEAGAQNLENMGTEALAKSFPELFALFDSLDIDRNGTLSYKEIFEGLKNWGYDAGESEKIIKALDINADNKTSFVEFIQVWPDIKALLVPRRFMGIVSVNVRSAVGITTPPIGQSDTYIRLSINDQTAQTKHNRRSSGFYGASSPTWNEIHELYVLNARQDVLTLQVIEGGEFVFSERLQKMTGKPLGDCQVPIASLIGRGNQRLKLPLSRCDGYLDVEVSYGEFVDASTGIVRPVPNKKKSISIKAQATQDLIQDLRENTLRIPDDYNRDISR